MKENADEINWLVFAVYKLKPFVVILEIKQNSKNSGEATTIGTVVKGVVKFMEYEPGAKLETVNPLPAVIVEFALTLPLMV